MPLTVPSVITGITRNVLDEEGGCVLKKDIKKWRFILRDFRQKIQLETFLRGIYL